jgi:hypothetical protein
MRFVDSLLARAALPGMLLGPAHYLVVFEIVCTGSRDFERFKREVLASLERHV